MTERLVLAAIILLTTLVGCQSGETRSGESSSYERRTTEYTYDKFGYQVNPTSKQRIDSAYNRRLEKQIGR